MIKYIYVFYVFDHRIPVTDILKLKKFWHQLIFDFKVSWFAQTIIWTIVKLICSAYTLCSTCWLHIWFGYDYLNVKMNGAYSSELCIFVENVGIILCTYIIYEQKKKIEKLTFGLISSFESWTFFSWVNRAVFALELSKK